MGNTKIDVNYVKDYLIKIGSKATLLSTEYKTNADKLLFKCSCGKIFDRCFSNIQQRKSCQCISCGHKKGWEEQRISSNYYEKIISDFYKCGYLVINKNEKMRKKNKILVEDMNGYRGYITLRNAQLKKHFSVFSIRFNADNLIYNLNNFCRLNNFGVKVLRYWKDGRTIRLECGCPCGNKYFTNVAEFTVDKRMFCQQCNKSQSRYERLVELELKVYDIMFVKQQKFDGCRSDITHYLLPFDFYLPNFNICVEVDGEQHFRPTNLRGMSDEKAYETYAKTSYNDKIKNKYCRNNNIQLIRINYIQVKNGEYKNIIQSIINNKNQ